MENLIAMDVILNKYNIDKNNENDYPFKIVDRYDSLALAHYDYNFTVKTESDNKIRNVRGVIVDVDKMEVVCESFGYTPVIVSDKIPEAGEAVIDVNGKEYSFPSEYTITPITEGTLIRVWKHKNEIMISSHRRINCEKSKWGKSGFFKSLFLKYIGDFNLESLVEDGSVANFILMDRTLLLASKIELDNKDGLVVYLGDKDINIPYLGELETNFEKSFFKINNLTLDQANNHLERGFRSEGEGVIINYKENGTQKVLCINSKAYYKRCKIVDNNPNILHRCYKLLSESYYPKTGDDKYLEKFDITPITLEDVFTDIPSNETKTYTEVELTDKSDKRSHLRRTINTLMCYYNSLALVHQEECVKSIKQLFQERKDISDTICKNYLQYSKGEFEGVIGDGDVLKYIQHRVVNAMDFAKKNSKNGKVSKDAILNNIRMGILRDSGDWLYNIARVLLRTKKTKIVGDVVINDCSTSVDEVCMSPNAVRFNN